MNSGRPGDLPAIRIEAENEWAWCGERRLDLTPRTFAVLRHLVERPQRLITKDDLLATVWRDTIVSDAALASCIRDLRHALGDSSRAPRYIETVHRRGFRFIGPTAAAKGRAHARDRSTAPVPRASAAIPTLVGRDGDLARLHRLFERAESGERQLVFVTGEPGIGKTALVDAFLSQIAVAGPHRIAHGQCVEQYGAGEAYLPILEALGRLGREAGGDELTGILKQCAPTWLMQLPALLADRDVEAVQRRAQGATRERLLRELIEALEALSRDQLLVLVLEDLHWSDASTIDVLARLARRPEPARLLVLGTYRPADVAGSAHPLRPVQQELQLHGHCDEIALEFLSLAAISDYLARRFPEHRLPPSFAALIHRTTDGNPLFVVNRVEYLIAHGQLREVDGRWGLAVPVGDIAIGTPDTLAQIVEKQVARLTDDEQAMLAVASVAGAEFSAAVAGAGGLDLRDAERLCAALARRGQFLRSTGLAEWPDGTAAGRYGFIHALYRNALYARVSIGSRVGLHLRIGALLERGYGQRAGEIAGELAMHFEHGRDFARAVEYQRQAGEHALRQHGYQEAARHATRALELLKALPQSPERTQQEVSLQVMLGSALYSSPEVERTFRRARELCEQMGNARELVPVLMGLGRFYLVRGVLPAARDVAQHLLTIAEATGDAANLLAAHNALGLVSFYAGELELALGHLDRGIELYEPSEHSPDRSAVFRAGNDPGVSCRVQAALTLWALGYPAHADARMREALALARSIAHPFSMAYAGHFAAALHLCRREPSAVQEHEDASFALSPEHEFTLFVVMAKFHRGWLLAEDGSTDDGLAQMREAVAGAREIGLELRFRGYPVWLAELLGKTGRPAEGLAVVKDVLAATADSGEHIWTAELHRVRGTLTLECAIAPGSRAPGPARRRGVETASRASSPSAPEKEAESCFLAALEVARRQRAKLFELRAATSLSRLWRSRGKMREARALLSGVYNWFTEGFDTADLREAKSVLDELEPRASGKAPVGSEHASHVSPSRSRRAGKRETP